MRQVIVNLPDDLARLVDAKVASGDYADASDVIREGLELVREHDKGFEDWLRDVAAPALAAMKADRSRRRSLGQVRASLDEAYRRAEARRSS